MLRNSLRRLMSIAWRARWCALAIPAIISPVAWSQEYSITELGTLGGSTSYAVAVNDAGEVVGTAAISGDVHSDPFLYSHGKMKDVWTGGTQYGGATVAINNSGHFVVNYNLDAAGDTESFIYTGSIWADLGIGGATAMNASDTVVGNGPSGYWLYSNYQLNPAPGYSTPGGHGAFVTGINDSGSIAGECQDADPAYGGQNGCVFGPSGAYILQYANQGGGITSFQIADNGETCGMDNFEHSAGWSNVGTEIFSVGYYGQCHGLDNSGDAVGFWENDSYWGVVGYIYDPINQMRDLNKLVKQTHARNAPVIVSAQSLSNTGFIAASCGFPHQINSTSWTLIERACLLTPNWPIILKDNIVALAKGDPGCIQCKTVLEPEANSLPSTFTGISAEEKKKSIATIETLEQHLRVLWDASKISSQATILLMHDADMALQKLGVGGQ